MAVHDSFYRAYGKRPIIQIAVAHPRMERVCSLPFVTGTGADRTLIVPAYEAVLAVPDELLIEDPHPVETIWGRVQLRWLPRCTLVFTDRDNKPYPVDNVNVYFFSRKYAREKVPLSGEHDIFNVLGRDVLRRLRPRDVRVVDRPSPAKGFGFARADVDALRAFSPNVPPPRPPSLPGVIYPAASPERRQPSVKYKGSGERRYLVRARRQDAPRSRPPRRLSASAERPAADLSREQEHRLYWNTRFPKDEAAQKRRCIFAETAYLLETALEPKADLGGLTHGAVDPKVLFPEGKDSVRVRFRMEASGAQLRLADDSGPYSQIVFSDELTCSFAEGTGAFAVELWAPGPGPVSLDLTLFVEGAATLTEHVELRAVGDDDQATSPGPVAAADTSSRPGMRADTLARIRPAQAYLSITESGGWYELELLLGSIVTPKIRAAAPWTTLANSAIRLRKELVELSEAYGMGQEKDDYAGLRLNAPLNAMLRFAQIGSQLYREFFGVPDDVNISQELREIARRIKELGQDGSVPRFQIRAERLPFPWAVLYDGPEPKAPAEVKPISFWGIRFQIDRVANAYLRSDPPAEIRLGRTHRIRSCINPNLDKEQNVRVVEAQKRFFRGLAASPVIQSRKDFEKFLKQGRSACGLLYFFCHAEAAQSMNTNYFNIGTPPVVQARIRLDDGPPITVNDMQTLHIKPLPKQPLVFLNACSSAQGDCGYQAVFLTHFLGTWQASGFIGTDWKVPTLFADAFGRLFLREWLGGLPIADAFRKAQEAALSYGNPFPLIYALYVRPELTVQYSTAEVLP